jgi:hypothetical protein
MSENVGASTSRNPKGLYGLYGDKFTLPLPYDDISQLFVFFGNELADS